GEGVGSGVASLPQLVIVATTKSAARADKPRSVTTPIARSFDLTVAPSFDSGELPFNISSLNPSVRHSTPRVEATVWKNSASRVRKIHSAKPAAAARFIRIEVRARSSSSTKLPSRRIHAMCASCGEKMGLSLNQYLLMGTPVPLALAAGLL